MIVKRGIKVKKQIFLSIMFLFFLTIFFLVSCIVPSPKIAYPTPANNASVFLFWDHFNYFESFDVWFGDSIENLEKLDTITVNHYTVDGLEWGKNYYWKVVGYKTAKNSLESPLWSFTVGNPHKGLLIGINDYDSASDLQLTDDDASDMKTALEATVFGYGNNLLVNRVVKT